MLLALSADLPLQLEFAGKHRSLLFFLAAGSTASVSASPWPELFDASLSMLSVALASPCCHNALCPVNWSFCSSQSPEHHSHRRLLCRGCCARRTASPLLLRSCSLLSRVRGELLNLPMLFVYDLSVSRHRRSAATPPCPPWPSASSCAAVISLESVLNRCRG